MKGSGSMVFEILKKEEFQKFVDEHPRNCFIQTSYMYDSQMSRNQDSIIVGIKDNQDIVCAGIVVLSSMKFSLKTATLVYGPVMDYNNTKLLSLFLNELERFLKKKKVLSLLIAPNIEAISYDDDFKPSPLKDIKEVVDVFENANFEYKGQEIATMHNNWIMVKDLKQYDSYEELFESYTKKTKNRARKAIENDIVIEEIGYDELKRFYTIEEHTSETREFKARNLSYFQSVYRAFENVKGVRVVVAKVNLKKLFDQSKEKLDDAQKEVDTVSDLIAENDTPRNQKKLNAAMDVYNSAKKQYEQLQELREKYPQDWVDTATRFYCTYGNEVVCIAGGALLDLDFLQSTVAIYVDTLKWAYEQGYERYNYFGIYTEDDTVGEVSPILHFKKGFGGDIINLIGTFEKTINPSLNKLYSSIKKVMK